MKYNRYLIGGIAVITLLLLFMFAGAVSGPTDGYISSICNHYAEIGIPTFIVGMMVPLILAGIYMYFKSGKGSVKPR
ncbi:hypothetical protein V7O66_00625 [Methanolobus sp. ZRKC3]|uniref:hypothetical protein n=1 Tax=Methanolobus sp. ZRKC3 TaxID=3125786 RepID=UPI0032466467